MKISALAVSRPVTTGMFFLAILVLGLIALFRLVVDQLPDVTRPSVSVRTTYEGAAPEIVERMMTDLLEKALATLDGAREIRSSSSEERSQVTIDFDWGTNVDLAAIEVHEKVNDTLPSLPGEIEPPRLAKYDPASSPIMYFNLTTGGRMSALALRHYAENTLVYQLQRIPGVASVDIWGGDEREIQVLVDRSRLEATGIALEWVLEAVRRANVTNDVAMIESARDGRTVKIEPLTV